MSESQFGNEALERTLAATISADTVVTPGGLPGPEEGGGGSQSEAAWHQMTSEQKLWVQLARARGFCRCPVVPTHSKESLCHTNTI